jgi:hypothetical protein
MEGNWQATEVGLQVNLGRETATRAAKRLIMLPRRSSKNRLPKSQRKSDLGIPLPYTWLNPSTRPRD